jgi:bifunctional enzyme CysN/CysC
MPVQWVNRPNLDFRGFSGQIVGGMRSSPATRSACCPAGTTTVDADRHDGRRSRRGDRAGQSVTITLTDEIDCSRGEVIAAADDPAEVADQFEAHIVWMARGPMLPGAPYLVKIGATQAVGATISSIRSTGSTSTPGDHERQDTWS